MLFLVVFLLALIGGGLIGFAVGRREGPDWRDVFDDSDEAGA